MIERATRTINQQTAVNRVIARCGSHVALDEMRVFASALSPGRLARLRAADAIVRRMSEESGFERQVWQFPVILIPLGSVDRPDSVVLRPIHSVDGMTASAVVMEERLLASMTERLLAIDGVAAVFYDLTHKPPATIEWE